MYIKYRGWASDRFENVFRIDIIDTETTIVGAVPEDVIVQSISLKSKEVKKTDAIHSSSLSFTLIAMRDMQFFELYSANQYKYKIQLYKNDTLIWSGHVDSEVYEENYNSSSRYPVTISASDLGLLKRNNFTLKGIVSIFDIVKVAVEVARIDFNALYIADTIGLEGINNRYLEYMYANSLNFENMTIYDVIDGVLKSLSLRFIYVAGNIYLTDFNILYYDSYTYNCYNSTFDYLRAEVVNHNLGRVKLMNADATLSVQPIYQNAEITYKVNPEENLINISAGTEWANWRHEQYVRVPQTHEHGFTITSYWSSGSKTMDIFHPLEWVKMTPSFSDAKVTGARTTSYSPTIGDTILQSKNVRLITPSNRYRMRVKMSVLLSVSENPFEPFSYKGGSNPDDNHGLGNSNLRDHSNIIYFYSDLYLKNQDGKVIYYYQSKKYDSTPEGWRKVTGNIPTKRYILAYYRDNRKNESPAGCLMTNGVFISSNNRDGLSSLAKNNIGSGDIIPVPPVPGYLEVFVYSGFECYDYQSAIKQNYSDFRWLIYEKFTIDIEDVSNGKSLSNEDIIYKCRINDYAKDEYKETILIGSNIDLNPLSKSSIYKKEGDYYKVVTNFIKNGNTKQLEDFRIISIFSNFGNKFIQINSTIEAVYNFGFFYENGKRMFKTGSEYDVISAMEKVTLTEFCADNYQIEIENE